MDTLFYVAIQCHGHVTEIGKKVGCNMWDDIGSLRHIALVCTENSRMQLRKAICSSYPRPEPGESSHIHSNTSDLWSKLTRVQVSTPAAEKSAEDLKEALESEAK
ncbi:hypothetical protein ACJJTC_005640 [Scirpophaga incertulas]